ncbi:alpha/beta hydrolase [Novosphingobium album (ex Liu et al. 2023)]|uniref:Alpha/beta hydrolase n=1 Tax=Novosphingobium album (ex Liu et al. 2023) TaxID=3031130 RepID=A0ABT5WUD6_9SPHN|nr:alpha/beta hydrolase [Novosphingobium album (ex Liu et al. 2023)]MDE8653520.1 alpha/beta hydrolase [Novosphingobium album (ex Liu et al. 2023)]
MARSRFVGLALAACCAGLAMAPQALLAKDAAVAARASEAAPYVRPDVKAFLERFNANPPPPFTREFLAMVRKLPPDAVPSQDLPPGDLAVMADYEMPGPGGPLKLRLFDARADRAPGPVVVFYHGGGYVMGSIDSYAGFAAEMARALDLPVVSVEYRLAPEHPWPAAPDDGEAAARWIAANGAAMGRSFTGLVLSGDSAGGNLTLVTAAALRDRPAALPVIMQIPIYPATDFVNDYPSLKTFAEGYLLDAGSTALFQQHYAADPKSLRASPLLGDLAGLPPTVLVTAGLDPLRDQGRAYAAKLIAAGVPTAYYEGKGLIHGFATFRKVIPSAQRDVTAFFALAHTMLESLDQPD